MRNLKRALSLTLASVMLLGMMVVGSSALSFNDADGITNVTAATVLEDLGIMQGDGQGNFMPEATVTRAQMAIIICRILYGNKLNVSQFEGTTQYNDVGANDYYTGYIDLTEVGYSAPVLATYTVSTLDNDGDVINTSDSMPVNRNGKITVALGHYDLKIDVTMTSSELNGFGADHNASDFFAGTELEDEFTSVAGDPLPTMPEEANNGNYTVKYEIQDKRGKPVTDTTFVEGKDYYVVVTVTAAEDYTIDADLATADVPELNGKAADSVVVAPDQKSAVIKYKIEVTAEPTIDGNITVRKVTEGYEIIEAHVVTSTESGVATSKYSGLAGKLYIEFTAPENAVPTGDGTVVLEVDGIKYPIATGGSALASVGNGVYSIVSSDAVNDASNILGFGSDTDAYLDYTAGAADYKVSHIRNGWSLAGGSDTTTSVTGGDGQSVSFKLDDIPEWMDGADVIYTITGLTGNQTAPAVTSGSAVPVVSTVDVDGPVTIEIKEVKATSVNVKYVDANDKAYVAADLGSPAKTTLTTDAAVGDTLTFTASNTKYDATVKGTYTVTGVNEADVTGEVTPGTLTTVPGTGKISAKGDGYVIVKITGLSELLTLTSSISGLLKDANDTFDTTGAVLSAFTGTDTEDATEHLFLKANKVKGISASDEILLTAKLDSTTPVSASNAYAYRLTVTVGDYTATGLLDAENEVVLTGTLKLSENTELTTENVTLTAIPKMTIKEASLAGNVLTITFTDDIEKNNDVKADGDAWVFTNNEDSLTIGGVEISGNTAKITLSGLQTSDGEVCKIADGKVLSTADNNNACAALTLTITSGTVTWDAT